MASLARSVKRHSIFYASLALLVVGTVAFTMRDKSAAQAEGAPQAVPVVTQTVKKESVRVWSEFSSKLVAVDAAVIRPEVSGRITEIRFDDGQTVKKGDIIYVIDPRPFEAAVAKSEASVATAETNAKFARTELARAGQLIKTQAIAQRIYDERNTANNVATANTKAAEAELKQARLDLEHAYVRAPISGRISRAEITVGNLVQSGLDAPVLTTIVDNSAVYADFQVDEQTYIQAVRKDAKSSETEREVPVVLSLKGDGENTYPGTIHSFDNQIDSSSGTIRARAKFDNGDGTLIPGMFASVRMGSSSKDVALLVPERAVGTDQSKKYVYVVGEGNKVAYREVTLGASMDGNRIVESGLTSGERIIVDGVQHVRPDAVVDPKDIADSSAPKADANPEKVAMK